MASGYRFINPPATRLSSAYAPGPETISRWGRSGRDVASGIPNVDVDESAACGRALTHFMNTHSLARLIGEVLARTGAASSEGNNCIRARARSHPHTTGLRHYLILKQMKATRTHKRAHHNLCIVFFYENNNNYTHPFITFQQLFALLLSFLLFFFFVIVAKAAEPELRLSIILAGVWADLVREPLEKV